MLSCSLSDALSNLHQTPPNVDCVSKVMCEQVVEALINVLPFSGDHFSHKYVIWYAFVVATENTNPFSRNKILY